MPRKIFLRRSMSTSPLHRYSWRAKLASESRSPCPALNTLANHGYIPRNGRNLTFFQLARATALVYNLSYPLAIFLALAGFATCGKLSTMPKPKPRHHNTPAKPQNLSWTRALLSSVTSVYNLITSRVNALCSITPTLDLSDLADRGAFKIAHGASLVHASSCSSTAPDADLLADLLAQSQSYNPHPGTGSGRTVPKTSEIPSKSKSTNGLTLLDLAKIHKARVKTDSRPLNTVHQQIALGECALTWLVLRGDGDDLESSHSSRKERVSTLALSFNPTSPYAKMGLGSNSAKAKGNVSLEGYDQPIPTKRLEQWFGEERLPDGWWSGVRPATTVGLFEARRVAHVVQKLCAESA